MKYIVTEKFFVLDENGETVYESDTWIEAKEWIAKQKELDTAKENYDEQVD